ncbi:MAG: threonine synthase [Clostridia bacterium]
MNYKSTRNSNISQTAAQAIAVGISTEGGLFVPETLPKFSVNMEDFMNMNYMERAREVLSMFLTDYTEEEICDCVNKAYDYSKFDGDTPAKLNVINDKVSMLELWHGPTCAFKDMALQILPHLLTKALDKTGDGKEAVILVATSGDTGKAALEGFKDVNGTKVIVFYPEKGVSPMQLRQMNTQEGDNVTVCAVDGNFDDCQSQVKVIFTNEIIKKVLESNNKTFSSANSINWGRLLPQIVYYFSSYADLCKNGQIKNGDKINFVVPTGNFGNILASFYAKEMGLPVNKLICASNSNNVLTEFISTGKYNKNRKFFTTNSPSMDILVSSNLERLLYHLCGEDCEKLKDWMNGLLVAGEYSVDVQTAEKVKDIFFAASCSDSETTQTIKNFYEKENYLCDTHTAVAVKVYEDYVKETGDNSKTVIVSTASPYKFAPSVAKAVITENIEDEFKLVQKLSEKTGLPVPKQILELQNKEIRFDNKADKTTIAEFVMKSIGVY